MHIHPGTCSRGPFILRHLGPRTRARTGLQHEYRARRQWGWGVGQCSHELHVPPASGGEATPGDLTPLALPYPVPIYEPSSCRISPARQGIVPGDPPWFLVSHIHTYPCLYFHTYQPTKEPLAHPRHVSSPNRWATPFCSSLSYLPSNAPHFLSPISNDDGSSSRRCPWRCQC